MKRFVLLSVLALMAAACKPTPPSPAPAPTPTPETVAPEESAVAPKVHEMDAGDVEATIHIDAVLADISQAANVVEERLEDRRQRLSLNTITVNPPSSDQLWITFKTTVDIDFSKTPVVLRGKILVDDVTVKSFAEVVTSIEKGAPDITVNVLESIATPPETMLVRAQAEALLMAPGTDSATIDAITASAPAEAIGRIESNPVRINFAAQKEGS